MPLVDRIKALQGWGITIIGLVLWILGAALVASEKVVPVLGAIFAAVGAILLVVGPVVFWLGVVFLVIEFLIGLFR